MNSMNYESRKWITKASEALTPDIRLQSQVWFGHEIKVQIHISMTLY